MDYEALLNEVLDIGKEMVKSGAETNRAEDSIYRMIESYDVEQCNVFVIQSNIQATIKPVDGPFITQIRRIHKPGFNYDRLDYLNNLSRYICQNKPTVEEIHEKYNEVMNRRPQPTYLRYLAAILGGVGFGVYFGCDLVDTIVGIVICALVEMYVGDLLNKKEDNLAVYNFIIAFLTAAAVFVVAEVGMGHHPDRIILGLNMVLISGRGVTNGIRDVLDRAYLSGILNIAHACLGAIAIACGTGLAMLLFEGDIYEMYIAPSIWVQLISCGVASMGFALVFKAASRQAFWAGVGGFLNCGCYLLGQHFYGNNMAAVMAGGMVPPLAIALCTTFFGNRFSESDRKTSLTNFIMGLSFITEGAIPFAAADPLRVIPSVAAGAATAGALSMAFDCTLRAPHGGIFVVPTIGNPAMYLVAIAIGAVVGCIIMAVLKKPISK